MKTSSIRRRRAEGRSSGSHLGGFHLGPAFFHDRIQRVVEALVALEPDIIAPAHCTGHRAAYAVYQRCPEAFVQNTVGTRIALSAEQATRGSLSD